MGIHVVKASLSPVVSRFLISSFVFTYCKVLFTAICLIKSKTHLFCTLLHLHEEEALRTNIKVSILRFFNYASYNKNFSEPYRLHSNVKYNISGH